MADCPANNTLLDFVERRLPAEVEERLHHHIDQCPACLGLVAELASPGAPPGPADEESAAADPTSASSKRPGAGPPLQFDEFRLLRPLGHGAMGLVYLGQDALLDRKVAIKFLAASASGEGARERFLIEARAIARLQHPNVVAVYRVGEVAGQPYLVSEFLRGQSLEKLAVPIPWERALAIGLGLARGLSAAHRHGVLHRDIKPANVILAEDGEVKLLDFGLAKLSDELAPAEVSTIGPAEPTVEVGEDIGLDQTAAPAAPGAGAAPGGAPPASASPALTRPGAIMGTPTYMAPEVWRGDGASARSDLYSLGALLYELSAGRPPHRAETLKALRRAAQDLDAPLLSEVAPAVDGRFAGVVHRCLRRDPLERFDSAEELCHALEQLTPAGLVRIPAGNPYRGLHAFEAEHRALFCGRGLEVRAILERLRAEPLVLLAGDSGVGKSSLCRAGILPLVAEEGLGEGRRWSVVSLVPGRHPLEALAGALCATLGQAEAAILDRLRGDPSDLRRALHKAQGDSAGTVIFIDQMEELLTQSDAAEAAKVGEILGQLGARGPGVRVLMTVRGDFLIRMAEIPGLGRELSRALHILRPLTRDGLREAVVEPARRTGVRFESEALVSELVESAAQAAGGLPLLQFALAELWELRDPEKLLITARALQEIGGTIGALARHADGVLGRLLPAARTAARRILGSLVTAEGTRSRRSEQELIGPPGADAAGHDALEALVRGRLLVASRTEDGEDSVYEVAHEALLTRWDTLRSWLASDAEARILRQRLERAAAEWARLGRAREALWSARQLGEVAAAGLRPVDLPATEAAFLVAARGNATRRRRLRIALLLGVPAALGIVYGGFALRAQKQTERAIAIHLGEAQAALHEARSSNGEVERLRGAAFGRFDAGDTEGGEGAWSQALALAEEAFASYAGASRALERALTLDVHQREVRRLFAGALYEQAVLADRDHRRAHRDDLIQRSTTYDEDGAYRRGWQAPAALTLATIPSGAAVLIERFEDRDGRLRLLPAAAPQRTPLAGLELPPGSYLLSVTQKGRAKVRYPVLLGRGERYETKIVLPAASAIPAGFVYVPPGRFLYGSADEETLRRDLMRAQPLHPVRTGAFLIGQNEVTYGEWLDFLRALPPPERSRRRPRVSGLRAALDLAELPDGGWQLTLQPTSQPYVARPGQPLRYPGRDRRASVDWLRLPVAGISWEDALAYTAWLWGSGRVPGARLCDEREWERAARGADERRYPHGDRLAPDDANYDETYGRHPLAFGPDEVGSHPASNSPFGVADLAGNVWEWARSVVSSPEIVYRGGGFYLDRLAALSANREPGEATMRLDDIGLRVCADPPPGAADGGDAHRGK